MIRMEHVSRWYGPVIGVNDISCQISEGITALLGPNGAGKSTLMKLITGQIRPTIGQVRVFGQNPFDNPEVLRRIGYCPEIENLYEDMTGREFVAFLGALSGIPSLQLREKVEEAIQKVGMEAFADRRIGGYSKGMRQRVKLAQALVHHPDLLVLDEPLSGLDPVGRRDITRLLLNLAREGKGVVISSHILYEVEQLTRNILLLHHGRLLAQGDIYRIRALIDAHPHRVVIETDEARKMAKHLLDLPYVISVRFPQEGASFLEVETRSPDSFYTQFPKLVLEKGFRVTRFESPDNNLEAVFKYLVIDQ